MTASYPLAERAAALSSELLPTLGKRWMHVQRVARRANEVTAAVHDSDMDLLVASAWLHDIGYAPEVAVSGFHPLDGARYLAERDWPARLVNLVAHHSGARYEAEERQVPAVLDAYEFEDGDVMDALVYADMTVGPAGEHYEFSTRIEEILRRYPPASPVHRAITRARPYLAGCVERTITRLAQPM